MSKVDIKRTQVHDTHMRYVILRLDYAGVTMNSDELVKVFDDRFPKAFKQRNYVTTNEVSLAFREEDFEDISKSASIPVNAIKRERVVRYSGIKDAKCQAFFDISQFYVCMTIVCDGNYDGLNQYVDIFKGAITLFRDKIPYFRPRRLGIRKCRQQEHVSIQDINTIFESFAFYDENLNLGNKNDYPTEFRSSFVDNTHNGIKINITRSLSFANNVNRFISNLDIDVYYDNDTYLERDINRIIDNANEYEFEVYKSFMLEAYLRADR